ncbi:MAG: bifunctional [glutamate--ammonia ligase]-adenylyl-L-tyrosine phosphorylase/[glutamate--ammonia-ligase] adenylyltransferase [Desulfobacterales bacterium]|nr:bifunctional [glutamate--ammonia ligase]-adenylyl-L-tyrosine phosphorylase/[glutamate--ammonia-ligase] adenylyltransferase [Desulfobacterales bacterium]
MNDDNHAVLPESLRAEEDLRWQAFSQAAAKEKLPFTFAAPVFNAARRVFVLSDFVCQTCTRHPALLIDLVTSQDLFNPYPPGGFAAKLEADLTPVNTAEELASALRKRRAREMVRIAFRDLDQQADLDDTMADLSTFADACLQAAFDRLYRWQCDKIGTPCSADGDMLQMVVVGMGKLGAGELNFSSDIDLIFAYSEMGETRGAGPTVSGEDFFARLARDLIKAIGANTFEGLVFRVDTRLRPFGENGPIVMSFDAMEEYYQSQGREWERYAWIKARPVAGDPSAGLALMQRLQPFIYRRYLDYGVFDSLRQMKLKISMEIKRKGLENNIKTGAGGIREIEFFGQMFQLMRGGVNPQLRDRQIQTILDALVTEEFIDPETRNELSAAYIFLRNTEHRLQELGDRQTHDLPQKPNDRLKVAVGMGFEAWNIFTASIEAHREKVHGHFSNLLETSEDADGKAMDASAEDDLATAWLDIFADEDHQTALANAGFTDSPQAMRLLRELQQDQTTQSLSQQGRRRLDRLMPNLLVAIGGSEEPELVLGRITDLLRAIQRRTNYLALLLENPSALKHLVHLASESLWIIAFLSKHPVLLDELLDPRTLYSPPEKTDLEQEIDRRLERLDEDDLEYQIEELCIFKQINTLKVAAADITGAIPLMRTSDHLTHIAEVIVDRVVNLSWNHLKKKHGRPACDPPGHGFVVIAYGKLGGIELGYGSDLDLVFLHAGNRGEMTDGEKPVDNVQFFARLGQRVVHILTTHTRAGRLYETDTRLRPAGTSGLLVSHIDSFRSYQDKEAWTWEHQALVRTRIICGDRALVEVFDRIRHATIARTRDAATLRAEVNAMRQKMRASLFRPRQGTFDLKQGNGGIVDIEFMVQYWVLRHAGEHPQLTAWSDNVRLLETLAECNIIATATAEFLKSAYLTFRAAVHKRNLMEKSGQVPDARYGELRDKVSALWKDVMLC